MSRVWMKMVDWSSEMSTLSVPGVRVIELARTVMPRGVLHSVL